MTQSGILTKLAGQAIIGANLRGSVAKVESGSQHEIPQQFALQLKEARSLPVES